MLVPSKILGNYTPAETAELNARDLDLGSSSPVLLGADLIVQGGKDGKMRLLSRKIIEGTAPHQGHEPASRRHSQRYRSVCAAGGMGPRRIHTWMFAADKQRGGTAATGSG